MLALVGWLTPNIPKAHQWSTGVLKLNFTPDALRDANSSFTKEKLQTPA